MRNQMTDVESEDKMVRIPNYDSLVFMPNGDAVLRLQIMPKGNTSLVGPVPNDLAPESLRILNPGYFITRNQFTKEPTAPEDYYIGNPSVTVIKGDREISGIVKKAIGSSLLIKSDLSLFEVKDPDIVRFPKGIRNYAFLIMTIESENFTTLPSTVDLSFISGGFSVFTTHNLILDFKSSKVVHWKNDVIFRNSTNIEFNNVSLSFADGVERGYRNRGFEEVSYATSASPRSSASTNEIGKTIYSLGISTLPRKSTVISNLFNVLDTPFVNLLSYNLSGQRRHPRNLIQIKPSKIPALGDNAYPSGKVLLWEGNEYLGEDIMAMTPAETNLTFDLGENKYVEVLVKITTTNQTEKSQIEQELQIVSMEVLVKNNSQNRVVIDFYHRESRRIREYATKLDFYNVSPNSATVPIDNKSWEFSPEYYGIHIKPIVQNPGQDTSFLYKFVVEL